MPKSLQKIYTEVPPTYEFLNHLLTLGQDIIWRRKAAKIAAAVGGANWLDVGIGTGEMAANLTRLAGEYTQITSGDFSLPMIQKAREKPELSQINFTLAEATHLPFGDNSFNAITLSFAANSPRGREK